MGRVLLLAIILLGPACAYVEDPDPPTLMAPFAPCPDAPDLCAEACRDEISAEGECGWTWGEPTCVCAPEPCDANACYQAERARRVCGTSPGGERVEACVAP